MEDTQIVKEGEDSPSLPQPAQDQSAPTPPVDAPTPPPATLPPPATFNVWDVPAVGVYSHEVHLNLVAKVQGRECSFPLGVRVFPGLPFVSKYTDQFLALKRLYLTGEVDAKGAVTKAPVALLSPQTYEVIPVSEGSLYTAAMIMVCSVPFDPSKCKTPGLQPFRVWTLEELCHMSNVIPDVFVAMGKAVEDALSVVDDKLKNGL